MSSKTYKKTIRFLKSAGTCVVIVGGCWILYQLRQTSRIIRSTIPTNVLNLEQAQYIYIDDPRYRVISGSHDKNDPHQPFGFEEQFTINFINKLSKTLNRMLRSRLLYMAQHGNKSDRRKAIYSLSSLSPLKDWHYRSMAQILDAKTAIALARMPNTDIRLFLPPPYYYVQDKLYDFIDKVHQMMLRLNTLCDNTHPCLMQFLNKNFKDSHRDGLIFDYDLTNVGLATSPTIMWDEDLLLKCIQTIYHHSSLEEYSKDIVKAGGLPILMMIQKIFQNNMDVCILLAKTLSNISLHSEYLEDIFQSGWIGKLVSWSRSKDARLSTSAGRALANLDIDENENIKYPRRIYLLYPLGRHNKTIKLDVIFLHGLLGGVFITWRQRDSKNLPVKGDYPTEHQDDALAAMTSEYSHEFFKDLVSDLEMHDWKRVGQDFEIVLDDCPENTNFRASGPYTCSGNDVSMKKMYHDRIHKTQCWPMDWLPEDVPSLRVIGINYDTNLSMWTPLCPIDNMKSTINERSDEYIKKLLMAGVGQRPISWVCHSMGGLLVKKMLVEEWKSGDKHNICKNTRSILFYSTPHRGSHVAALRQTTQLLLWPSIEVQELSEGSPHLLRLHEEFLDMLNDYPIEIISFSESKSTLVTPLKFPFLFVTPKSADPGVGEFFEIPQDHVTICKPASRQSFLYQKLLSTLRRHINPKKESRNLPSMNLLSLPRKFI